MKLLAILFLTVGLLNAKMVTLTHKPKPIHYSGEKHFRDFKFYTLRDFNFKQKLSYFDIVHYEVGYPYSNEKKLYLPKRGNFYTLWKFGRLKSKINPNIERYFEKINLKPSYFWKYRVPLINRYDFYSMRFVDAKDKRLYVVTEMHDFNDILGKIDNEAKLQLWIKASSYPLAHPYSYKKIGNTYRVHFFNSDIGKCYYDERFKFYNENGDVIKEQKIRSVHVKGCKEIMSL